MRTIPFFLLLMLMGFSVRSGAQGQAGIVVGISNYQGDLESLSRQNGFRALIGPVAGVSFGYEWTRKFQSRGEILYTRLSGDDALNTKMVTRSRNLSFFSPVIHLSAAMDWNILGFSSKGERGFTPYASVGAGIFYFNPKTEYQGRIVALRPLGTEGQFLADYPDQKPYSLIQPSLLFGGGLKLMTTGRLILAVETMLNLTFTDYLDDASTIYISYPELLDKAGPLTAALANRQGEFLGTEPVIVPTGTSRANADSKDLFGTIVLKALIPVKIQSARFKVKGHNKKRIHCPKF